MEDVYEANIQQLERELGNGEASILKNLRATVRYGTVREGYGLELRLLGESVGFQPSVHRAGRLDVHGDSVFNALPQGMGGVARMMLPLKIRLAAQLDGGSRSMREGDDRTFSGQIVLGAHKLSRSRIDSLLQDMIDAGDVPFVLEFQGGTENGRRSLLGFLPTKASLVQRGLTNNALSVVHRGSLPPMKKHLLQRAMTWTRWWLCPALFALWCWTLLLEPAAIMSRVPSFIPQYDNVTTVLPLHPTSMEQAFRLGVLHERLRLSSSSMFGKAGSESSILREAEGVVGKGRGTVRAEELHNVLLEIQKIESARGVTSRVLGFFTFVNIMWVSAIIGMTVSIGPSLVALLWPLRDFLRRVWRAFVDNVLRPVVVRLHHWGMLELSAFAACMLLVAEGHRMQADGREGGLFVSLTGALVVIPSFFYSTLLWAPRAGGDQDALAKAVQVWLMLCWAPCAIAQDSTLFGYLTVVALYGALEFSIWVGNLVWCIGFTGRAALQRCAVVSLLVVSAFAAARAWDVEQAYMRPFAQPVQVFGSVVGLLAMLIASSWLHEGSEHHRRSNAVMFAALILTQSVGHMWGMVGMANVGTTFMVLWLMDKYASWHNMLGFDSWVLVLLLSAFVWRASLFLHMHPEFVASMLTL